MPLKTVAEDYFSKLNPMASRMYVDMNETKLAYEKLWNTISDKEQKEILSDTIIKPEVSIKYQQKDESDSIKEYAKKFIIDDSYSYRDEHSGPFSFKTRSQRDLSLWEKCEQEKKSQPKIIKQEHKRNSVYLLDEPILEPTENKTSTLPKTGLDFLDNW